MSATQSWLMPVSFHLARQVRIDLAAVIGIGGHHELPLPQAQQVVFAHDPANPFVIHRPALPSQFGGDPRPAVAGQLQGDPLDGVAQVHIPIRPSSRPSSSKR